MSILIKGMEMPENCFDCAWSCKIDPKTLLCRISGEYFDKTLSNLIDGRDKNCPLIEVPPHGRLIDADALIKYQVMDKDFKTYTASMKIYDVLTSVCTRQPQIIIEAEKEEEI